MHPLLLAAAIVAGVAALYIALHAVLVAPFQLVVSEHEVPIADLAEPFDGYTMVALADVHAPPYGRHGQLQRAVAVARSAQPDLVLLLGDYGASVGWSRAISARFYRSAMPAAGPLLAALDAPDGVIAVLGNHDYYFDGTAVADWLRGLGVRVLVNEHVVIARDGAQLVIGGTDDLDRGRVDPAAGCAGAPPAPTIVLAHNPDSVTRLTPARRVDLVMSGHTHGGQIVLPAYGALVTFAEICTRTSPSGWVPNGRAPLLVSRGLGGDIPLRFNCPPEVMIVRLARGTGAPRLVRQWGLRGVTWWQRPGGGRRAAQQPA